MENPFRIQEEPGPSEKLVSTNYGFLDSPNKATNEGVIRNEVLDLTKHSN